MWYGFRFPFALMVRPAHLAAFALGLVGCGYGEGGDPYEPPVAPADEQELVKLDALVTEASGETTLAVAGQGSFDCGAPFERPGAIRIECARDARRIELVHATDHTVLIDRPSGRGKDVRTFFTCKGTGSTGKLPKKLACDAKKPAARPGGLSSPLPPTLAGVTVPNAHAVGGGGYLVRGMAPHGEREMDELRRAGVQSVLIFKNATGRGTEIGDELGEWALPDADQKHVPFAWKSLPPFSESCAQTLEALRFVAGRVKAKHKVYLHCTVGEDRTGYLAALYRIVTERIDPKRAFDDEMCERGYAAGNPLKPAFVVAELDRGLTPLYRKMAWLAKSGALDDRFDARACAKDPASDPAFAREALAPAELSCGTSTRFEP